jgi:hypothetical protein
VKDGVARVPFPCRDYLITDEGAFSADGRSVDVNDLSVLLYYILSDGSGELSGDFMRLPFKKPLKNRPSFFSGASCYNNSAGRNRDVNHGRRAGAL